MSTDHRGGNIQNEITLEEHDGTNNAKRVNVVAGGVGLATVTLNDSDAHIGSVSIFGTVASSSGNVTINSGPNQIGSITISNSPTVYVGTPTLFAVVNTEAPGIGNSIVTIANTPLETQIVGNVTIDSGSITVSNTINANVSLSSSISNIGFATVSVSNPTLYAVVNTGGANTGNITINPGPNQIGSVTVSNPITIGNAMVTVTLGTSLDSTNDSVAIGQALPAGTNFIGLATVTGSALDIRSLNSTATLFAVVNTEAASLTGNVTLNPSPNSIGLVTLNASDSHIGSVSIFGTVESTPGMTTIFPGPNQIGSVTISNTPTVFLGTPTLFAVVNTSAAGTTDVTSDSGVTVYQGGTWTVTQSSLARSIVGNVTVEQGDNPWVTSVVGNITLSDSNTYIGLVTATVSNTINANVSLSNSLAHIGSVSIFGEIAASTGMTTIFPGPNYIGLVTATLGAGTATIGIVRQGTSPWTVDGTVSANQSGTWDVGLSAGANYIGLASVNVANIARTITGNLTLSDSNTFIGLVTVSGSDLDVRSLNSTATLFAVVNTSAAGTTDVTSDSGVTVYQGDASWTVSGTVAATQSGTWTVQPGNTANTTPWLVSPRGNVTLSDSTTYIGLTTTTLGVGTRYIGLVTADIGTIKAWNNPNTYIGLVTSTIANTINANVSLSNSEAHIGSVSIFGEINTSTGMTTLFPGPNYIGLVTAVVGNTINANVSLSNSLAHIGSVSIFGEVTANTGMTTLFPGPNFIGLVTAFLGNTSVQIGNAMVTVTLGTSLDSTNDSVAIGQALPAGSNYIGLTTATLGVGTQFIGLVTAGSRDLGSTKTFIPKSIELSTGSVATVFVATNTWKMTQLMVNSNATVRVSIKSGATYLTGNASIGVELNPGGGWVENGSPRSPIYIGLAVAQGIVIEKTDYGGTLARVSGKVMFIDE
jgi:hypothetical protein